MSHIIEQYSDAAETAVDVYLGQIIEIDGEEAVVISRETILNGSGRPCGDRLEITDDAWEAIQKSISEFEAKSLDFDKIVADNTADVETETTRTGFTKITKGDWYMIVGEEDGRNDCAAGGYTYSIYCTIADPGNELWETDGDVTLASLDYTIRDFIDKH